jgi:hypothetical protein
MALALGLESLLGKNPHSQNVAYRWGITSGELHPMDEGSQRIYDCTIHRLQQ